jgi:hypothetical protein
MAVIMVMAIVLIMSPSKASLVLSIAMAARAVIVSSANDLRAVASVYEQPRRIFKLLGNPFQVGDRIKVIGVPEAPLNHFL